MSLAEKYCLTAAFIFFMTGLVSGIWKYRLMVKGFDHRARYYVDITHRSSLMYSFAAILLAKFAELSVFPAVVNNTAALATLIFFAAAIFTYIVHGVLRDTTNQLEEPHRVGNTKLPAWLTPLFMLLLIIAEVGGSAVLGVGALLSIWW
ncbi:hypothetical protein [Alkalimarinus alittae]|uniref:Integral membrane protein n=1 Tax=Alkalimarinus alittae TaxID=2961619 RepID=A0ABY6N2J7_9ALTE|nr:hypothetical protein [Alkalimarinus alittae]UZE96338.1 hypothetical protein NKI27_00920 [Alkalimarinus alittae]